MLRLVSCAVLGLVLLCGSLLAEEIKGTIKEIQANEGIITVDTDDGLKKILVNDKTMYVGQNGKKLKNGPKDLKAGSGVVITCEKDVASEIKIAPRKGKK